MGDPGAQTQFEDRVRHSIRHSNDERGPQALSSRISLAALSTSRFILSYTRWNLIEL